MAKRTNGCAPIVGLLVIIWLLSKCGGNETPPAPPLPPMPTPMATAGEASSDTSVREAVDEAIEATDEPSPSRQRQTFVTPAPEDEGDEAPSVYYRNCRSARAAGVTPIHEGEPGYAYHLDRDHDGIACE